MRSSQSGLTFIEVLVALFVLTTGILGAIAMQATAHKSNFDAMERSIASSLAQDIIESIRANKSGDTTYNIYAGTYGEGSISPPAKDCQDPSVDCSATEMANADVYQWEQKLIGADVTQGSDNKGGLVGGHACITYAANLLNVVISWQSKVSISDGNSSSSCGISGDKRRQIEVETFIY